VGHPFDAHDHLESPAGLWQRALNRDGVVAALLLGLLAAQGRRSRDVELRTVGVAVSATSAPWWRWPWSTSW
jgi:hypothetical protein